jgi:NDP-sugar pyrophosphorylase family protein
LHKDIDHIDHIDVVVLAAGLGTRLRPLGYNLPKALVPFLNLPLIAHTLGKIARLGFERVIVNTHYKAEMLKDFLSTKPFNLEIEISYEPLLLGTGGALFPMKPLFRGDKILMMNADIVSDFPVETLIKLGLGLHYKIALGLCRPLPGETIIWKKPVGNEVWQFGGSAPGPDALASGFACHHFFSHEVLAEIRSEPHSIIDVYRKSKFDILGVSDDEASVFDLGTPNRYWAALDAYATLMLTKPSHTLIVDYAKTLNMYSQIQLSNC